LDERSRREGSLSRFRIHLCAKIRYNRLNNILY